MWTLFSDVLLPGKPENLPKHSHGSVAERQPSKRQTMLYQEPEQRQNKTDILRQLTEYEEDSEFQPSSLISSASGSPQIVTQQKAAEAREVFNTTNTLMAFLDDPVKSSNVLYWPCETLSFIKSDFDKLLPNPSAQVIEERLLLGEDISGDHAEDISNFQVIRSRHPKTLNRWIGYFLVFPSRHAAIKFYEATLGSELCGMQLLLSFVDPRKPNIHPPLLYEVPGVSRSMCALVSGLPPRMSKVSIARALWEYDLLGNESQAIVKLTGDGYASESSWLLRFKNENEPQRLRRKYHRRQWPLTTMTPFVEILD